jgi:hypothetical protein
MIILLVFAIVNICGFYKKSSNLQNPLINKIKPKIIIMTKDHFA